MAKMTAVVHNRWMKVVCYTQRCGWCEEKKAVFYVCLAAACKKHACHDCTATPGKLTVPSGIPCAVHILDANAVSWSRDTDSFSLEEEEMAAERAQEEGADDDDDSQSNQGGTGH